MSGTDLAVIVGGFAAIAWVNWYFFLAGRTPAAALSATVARHHDGAREVTITVHGGYEPATIPATAGQSLRLVFDRQETSSCSEEVVFPDFRLRRFLPAWTKTTVEITPPHAGRFEFACGMGMLHGVVVAEEARHE
jgi:plastocyanin domain-containing protein